MGSHVLAAPRAAMPCLNTASGYLSCMAYVHIPPTTYLPAFSLCFLYPAILVDQNDGAGLPFYCTRCCFPTRLCLLAWPATNGGMPLVTARNPLRTLIYPPAAVPHTFMRRAHLQRDTHTTPAATASPHRRPAGLLAHAWRRPPALPHTPTPPTHTACLTYLLPADILHAACAALDACGPPALEHGCTRITLPPTLP